MISGKVEQIGTPLELYDHPANLFVAGFIGSPAMNFIPGVLQRNGGEAWVATPDGGRLPAPPNGGGEHGQRIVYGARPEHLDIAGEGGVPATVRVVEPTGADTFVYAELAGTQLCAVFGERHVFRPGETIRLQPRLDSVHLFDAESGKKLH